MHQPGEGVSLRAQLGERGLGGGVPLRRHLQFGMTFLQVNAQSRAGSQGREGSAEVQPWQLGGMAVLWLLGTVAILMRLNAFQYCNNW